MQAAWSATGAALGTPSILVNSAGILGPSAGIASYPEEMWHRVLDINLNGTFRCCQAAVPDMVASGYGRIVNIASIAGKDGNPNVAAYVASKAAVIALTKSMGKELATSGVLVNAITPSASETAIFGDLTDERRAKLLANVPMARMVRPEEVAELTFWLTSPGCSSRPARSSTFLAVGRPTEQRGLKRQLMPSAGSREGKPARSLLLARWTPREGTNGRQAACPARWSTA